MSPGHRRVLLLVGIAVLVIVSAAVTVVLLLDAVPIQGERFGSFTESPGNPLGL